MDKRRMCPNCRAFITSSDRTCPYCDSPVGPRAIDIRDTGQLLAGFIPHARFTTVMILLINLCLYIATAVYSMSSGEGGFMDVSGRTLWIFGAKVREEILVHHQWWRLVTAGFLHGGILHILMNSWVLFDLGAQVEEVYGPNRMITIYFVSTVFGFLTSTFWTPALSIGASAGLMGLIGAMIAVGTHHRSSLGAAIRGQAIRWAIYIMLFGFLVPGIDNAAHLGGLTAGFVCAWIAGLPKLVNNWVERFWQFAAYTCLGLTALSFLEWFLWFRALGQ
jgi:rhomboid protease GluP